MEEVELAFQQKVDISEAIATSELVAFNCTCDREIILAIATKPLNYRRYNKSGASFAKVKTKTGQDYRIFYTVDDTLINLANIKNEPFNIHEAQFLTGN
ncbi:MAG: hypothetical protein AAGE96_15215 [Cyanobacteria bacterium P01_G01_bin.19]